MMKCIKFISNRLSTTRFVDKIYMLEDGRIIEQGNHDTLLALKGKYADFTESFICILLNDSL
ncbi:MAG: hypothetical protein J6C37_08860 [Roseburia sp.]|nr:hypothetical protein [Roseburia sp.]